MSDTETSEDLSKLLHRQTRKRIVKLLEKSVKKRQGKIKELPDNFNALQRHIAETMSSDNILGWRFQMLCYCDENIQWWFRVHCAPLAEDSAPAHAMLVVKLLGGPSDPEEVDGRKMTFRWHVPRDLKVRDK
mgnify:CR=1 FL=1